MKTVLPELSRPPVASPFAGGPVLLGRERELSELRRALANAAAGRGSVMVLTGVAGIGKSLLVETACREAETSGMGVGRGAGWEAGGAPAHWPWIEALTSLDGASAALLAGESESGDASGAKTASRTTEQSGSARFARFGQLRERLAELAAKRPVLIALEDLQNADAPSLLLLRFLAPRIRALPVVVVASVRTPTSSAESTLLADLCADAGRIALTGLDPAHTAELAHLLGERRLSVAVTRRLHQITEGNPLFVKELVRMRPALAEDEPMIGAALPPTVLEVLRRSVAGIDPADRDVLALGALCGAEFDPALVRDLSDGSPEAVAAALERAIVAGLLEIRDGGRRRFVHGLLRTVLLERLPRETRPALHLRLATLLEADSRLAGRTAHVAHHYRQAVPVAPATLAVRTSLDAARGALRALAFEEAARHAEEALELAATAADELQLLLLVGEARMAAGDPHVGRTALTRAADLAEQTGQPELRAQAALLLGGGPRGWARREVDRELVALLETTARGLPEGAQRARVLARLAAEIHHGRQSERGRHLALKALAEARRSGDDRAIVDAVEARLLCSLTSTSPAERGVLVNELSRSARRSEDPDLEQGAGLWRLNHALEGAERDDVERARAELHAIAVRTGAPHQLWNLAVTDAMLSLLDGRLEAAEERMAEALDAAEGVVDVAPGMYAVQLMALRREQGRLAEVEPLARRAASEAQAPVSWRCAWIGILCELGREEEARAELGRLPGAVVGTPPGLDDALAANLMLAELAARLADGELAARLPAVLGDHAGQVAVVSFSVLCRGAVDRYLGLLATATGDHGLAEQHFRAAQRLHARLGSPLWTARTEIDRAVNWAAAGDTGRARRALRATVAQSQARGWPGVGQRASMFLEQMPEAPRAQAPSPAPRERLLFRHDAGVWSLGDPRAPLRVPHARGLGYIQELLRHPGQELYAAELAGSSPGSEQTVLDPRAKAAYRARLEELRADLDEAERFADPERATRARAELDAVGTALAQAVGLRGRDRQLSASGERARSSVTKAIRAAVGRIAEHDPVLGAHLDGALRTGTFCRYVPDPRHPIDWQLTM